MTKTTLGKDLQMIIDSTPTGRVGNDEDLKGATVLLASDAGAHITGQTLVVDGGATII
jgi:gluconate 5-dehydrogenase